MFSKSRDEHSCTEEAFFRFISERIRGARIERAISQQDQAHFLYKTGKALDEPISYFFPPLLTRRQRTRPQL